MKRKMKKLILVLGITFLMMGSSLTVLASSCLDVRDYGYHRNNNRFVKRVETGREVVGMSNGKVIIGVYFYEEGFCVCGQYGRIRNGYERKEVPFY